MRHLKNSKRLGRTASHRKAMFRNMATSLLDYSRIETTEIKAKELRRYVERMITLGKRGDLHARRQALAFLRSKDVVGKVFGEYAERFKNRPGGYTRIMKLGTRPGDNARMAIIEILGTDEAVEKEKTKKATEGTTKKEVKEKKEKAKKPESKKPESKKPVKKAPEAQGKQPKAKKAEKSADTAGMKPGKKEKKRSREE